MDKELHSVQDNDLEQTAGGIKLPRLDPAKCICPKCNKPMTQSDQLGAKCPHCKQFYVWLSGKWLLVGTH